MSPFEITSLALQLWEMDRASKPFMSRTPEPDELERYMREAIELIIRANFVLHPKTAPSNEI